MKNSPSPWFKASLAAFSASVVCTVIAVFSYASDTPTLHLTRSIEPIHSVSTVASPVVSSVAKAITRQMIMERTASCAEMLSAKDKLRCLNKRLKMKRDFQAQEKLKCDKLEVEAGKSQCLVELDTLKKGLRSV